MYGEYNMLYIKLVLNEIKKKNKKSKTKQQKNRNEQN